VYRLHSPVKHAGPSTPLQGSEDNVQHLNSLTSYTFPIVCIKFQHSTTFRGHDQSPSSCMLVPKQMLLHNNYFHCEITLAIIKF
jgi:hypothetical protein